MERLSIDSLVSSVSAGRKSQSRIGGFEKQWKRHLEKTYFEKQVALMRSTGACGEEQKIGSQENSTPKTGCAVEDLIEPIEAGSIQVPDLKSNRLEKYPCENVGAGNCVHGPSTSASATYEIYLHRLLNDLALEKVGSGGMKIGLAKDLKMAADPLSAFSMSLLHENDGFHLVVRDLEISKDTLLRLVISLAKSMAAEHQQLVAITLNGERIWERHPEAVRGIK